MKRFFQHHRPFLVYLLIAFTIISSACNKQGSEDRPNRSDKPNIILILADDVGYEVPAYTGGQSYQTPAIDNLARQGMRFTQCHVCPNCSPTRVELLTGKYNFRNYTGWGNMHQGQKTIANLLRNAGYATCVAGKWQLGGGDASIREFGFDKYRVFLPFHMEIEEEENKRRYKNPHIYQDGKYLADDFTYGKHADDMFVDYISGFIENNTSNPFFIYFPLSLCHAPFSPTPDDAAFATWNPLAGETDKTFFPSMVRYMDKKVQQVVDKIRSAGLEENTVIIFLGDNGTPRQIYSSYEGQLLRGGKGTTTKYGTHVPLIVKYKGVVMPQQVCNGLVDASDFLPTIAALANTSIPSNYGKLDGISFKPLLLGSQQRLRDWIYCYWHPQNNPHFKVWVQDENYKLYDTTNQNLFFKIAADALELNPVPQSQLSATEISRKKTFDSVLSVMR